MVYVYRCATCNNEVEMVNKIAERRTNAPVCCGEQMGIVIQPVRGFVDREIHYRCPVTNEGVTSRKQRNELMARNDLIDANDIVNSKTIQEQQKKHEQKQKWIDKHRIPDIQKDVESWAMAT